MKIGIIARTWFTSIKGGSERYIARLLEELRESHQVKAITLDRSEDKDVIQLKLPRISLITQFLFSVLASRKMNKIHPNVCIINQYWGELSPLFLKVPWIPVIHDIGLFYSEWARKHRLKHFIRTRVLSQVTKKAKLIIVPSQLTAQDLHKYLNVPIKKICLIPEGIDLSEFKSLPVRHKGVNIVCVARIAPNKGQAVLIKAFKYIKEKYPASKLYFVGGVSKYQKNYRKKLDILVQKLKMDDVIFTGYVSEKELIKYYNLADIYVQPSVGEEGWGITIVEAYGCKKPVICTEIFYKTGVAAGDRAHIVKCNSVGELAKAIELLIEDKELCRKLAEAGYAFAQRLSWKRTADTVLKAVNHLVDA